MQKTIVVGAILFVIGVVVGRTSVNTPSSAPTPSTPAPAMEQQPAPTTPSAGTLRGTVAEVIQVSQYTYLKLDSGQWAAVEKVPSLQVGQQVGVLLQTEMKDFTSPSLNRTFESLWFGTLEGAPPSGRSAETMPAAPPPSMGTPSPDVKAALAAVDSAGALSLRVGDVYATKSMLEGQRVRIKGTVDRAMEVQGKHYVHLKDGTGAAADKTDDLLVISAAPAEKGAQVTMEGTVVLNKDLGMGPVPVALDGAVQR